MPTKDVTNTEMFIPEFQGIIDKCIHELRIKFEAYGNSWMTESDGYWAERIINEADEFSKSLTEVAAKRKLLNLINMAAMAHETYKMPVKCSACGK